MSHHRHQRPSPAPLLLVALLTVGCRQVFPYGAASVSGDGGAGNATSNTDAGHDGTKNDTDSTGAADASDAPGGDDGPAAVDGTADGCNVAPTLNVGGTCSTQCTSPAGDSECDGLPDPRDPWPNQCNTALVGEDFVDLGGWIADPGPATWACGQGTLRPGATLRHTAPLSDLGYLTEAALVVEQIVDPQSWEVGLRTAVDGPQVRGCSLWFDSAQLSSFPTLRSWAVANVDSYSIADGNEELTGFAPGTLYVLQIWTEPTGVHHCRVLDANDQPMHQIGNDYVVIVAGPAWSGAPCGDGACPGSGDLCVTCPMGHCCESRVYLGSPGSIELFARGAQARFSFVHVLANPPGP